MRISQLDGIAQSQDGGKRGRGLTQEYSVKSESLRAVLSLCRSCWATKGGGQQAGRCQDELFLLAGACNGETGLSWRESTGATSQPTQTDSQEMLAVPNSPIGGPCLASQRTSQTKAGSQVSLRDEKEVP